MMSARVVRFDVMLLGTALTVAFTVGKKGSIDILATKEVRQAKRTGWITRSENSPILSRESGKQLLTNTSVVDGSSYGSQLSDPRGIESLGETSKIC